MGNLAQKLGKKSIFAYLADFQASLQFRFFGTQFDQEQGTSMGVGLGQHLFSAFYLSWTTV